jgi:hypothetical protein
VPLSTENSRELAPTFFADFEKCLPTLATDSRSCCEPRGAAGRLPAAVYEQLRGLARARMARLSPGQTLRPTAPIHGAYPGLMDRSDIDWESRQHFFFTAARAVRDILVEQARRKAAPGPGRAAPPGPG